MHKLILSCIIVVMTMAAQAQNQADTIFNRVETKYKVIVSGDSVTVMNLTHFDKWEIWIIRINGRSFDYYGGQYGTRSYIKKARLDKTCGRIPDTTKGKVEVIIFEYRRNLLLQKVGYLRRLEVQ